MKNVITATVIALAATATHAGPFDFERQIGTDALFPTIVVDGYTAPSRSSKSSPIFTHERIFGDVALYPTLVSEEVETNVIVDAGSAEPFNYWVHVWHTDVEIGG